MVKFSKQFEGQLVPEWKEAFVDYWQLKKDLKKIPLLNTDNNATNKNKNKDSSFSSTLISSIRKLPLFGPQRREHGVIQVLTFSFLLVHLIGFSMCFLDFNVEHVGF